jgi:hypothetical protein
VDNRQEVREFLTTRRAHTTPDQAGLPTTGIRRVPGVERRARPPPDYTDNQAITSIAQITRGIFRLLERLLVQIERVLKINEPTIVANDLVEAARSTLVIGVAE